MSDTLRCIVVDDDPLSRALLENFISRTEFLSLLASCADGVEAVNLLRKEPVDLVFLDVEMPEMTGLQLIESLSSKPEIVLVTSKEEYAVEAFEHDVLDYIVKPATYARFLRAAGKAQEKQKARSEIRVDHTQIFIRSESRLVPIDIDSIQFVEAKADYVTIHCADKRHTVYSTMKGIESKLPGDRFIRVHRSFIVNKNKITAIEDNLVIIGDKLIPVGVTYKDKLMKDLNLL